MNIRKYPESLKYIKGRPGIKDYKTNMSGNKSSPSSPLAIRRESYSISQSPRSSPHNEMDYQSTFSKESDRSKESEEDGEGSYNEESAMISESYDSRLARNKSTAAKTSFEHVQTCSAERNKSSKTIKAQKPKQKGSSIITPLLICFIVIGFPIFVHRYSQEEEHNYKKHISDIKAKFPSQDQNFWSVIMSGLGNVIETDLEKTAVFLFLNSNSQDKKTLSELSNKIADIAAKGLGSKSPLILSKADILSLPNENGYFIAKYRPKLEEQKVLLIHNLHEVPASIAQSFHYFCDSINPIVKKSVIIFTMDIPKLPTKNNLLQMVEHTLQNIWSPPLNDNVIHPLITRLTTNVVAVTPELIYYG